MIIPNKIKERFYRRILKKDDGCWEWQGTKDRYGFFRWKGWKGKGAHRFSYLLHKGDIKEKEVVMHICDKPLCVNPDHLKIGSQKDNMLDCIKKGRFKTNIQNLKPYLPNKPLCERCRNCQCRK